MQKPMQLLVITALSLLLISSKGKAQVQDFERSIGNSDLSVIGSVSAIRSQWTEDHTQILSKITLNPTETLKGSAYQEPLTVWVLGGSIGDTTFNVSVSPEFKVGEKVFVLLIRSPRGGYSVNGWDNGKITILANGSGEFHRQVIPSTELKRLKQMAKM